MRLVRLDQPWQEKAHFFAAAANSMRQILINSTLAKKADKRGGGARRIDRDDFAPSSTTDPDMRLDLDQAVTEPAAEDPDSAELFKLRLSAALSKRSGRSSNAVQLCEQAMQQTLEDSPPLHEVRYWPRQLAVGFSRTAVAAEPENSQFKAGLAAILFRAGGMDEAHKVLSEVLATPIYDGTSPAYAHYFLSMTEHQRGRSDEAKSHL